MNSNRESVRFGRKWWVENLDFIVPITLLCFATIVLLVMQVQQFTTPGWWRQVAGDVVAVPVTAGMMYLVIGYILRRSPMYFFGNALVRASLLNRLAFILVSVLSWLLVGDYITGWMQIWSPPWWVFPSIFAVILAGITALNVHMHKRVLERP